MEKNILKKNYFGRNYTFMQSNMKEIPSIDYIRDNGIDGIIIVTDVLNKEIHDIQNISILKDLRGLNLNSYFYEELVDLSHFRNLEYLKMSGKANGNIPFSSLSSLWCIYLNYNKKNCKSIFECKNLEYIFIDNYTEISSKDFVAFEKAKSIGLIKNKIMEFDAIKNMSQLEHIGIGYNPNMESISWIKNNNSLISVAFKNCKRIKDWEEIGTLGKIEKLVIENCGELPSLDFLQHLSNLKEIRIIGSTSIKDGKIKETMRLPQLKYLFVPVRKEYDVTLQDITAFNNKL